MVDEAVADGVDRPLDPRSVIALRLAGAIGAAVVTGATLLVLLPSVLFLRAPLSLKLVLLAGWLALTAALAAWSYFWPAVRYPYVSYRVEPRGITIRRGVFWRSVKAVPQARVQHTDVSQGPIERAFGLATLVIHTAGTHEAAIHLGGLAHETALRVRDHLIGGGEDDAV
ncbi:MAG TPA: PH domain-containing protein [Candidatus Polarisedimenticolaceae bacterium]|nr:PH domain-containing protein [Candidatus Polarisedimenticolaceae bacterium]